MDYKNPSLVCKFKEFKLTFSPLNLFKNDQAISMTPKSLELLRLLIKNQGQVVSKEMILKEVWRGLYVSDSVLVVNINTLRKILGADLISNRRGLGYVFNDCASIAYEDKASSGIDDSEEDLKLNLDSFIGRERELKLLQLNYRTISENRGMATFISGEAGVGKTNLVRKFLTELSKSNDNLVLTTSFFDFVGSGDESASLYFKLLFQAFSQLGWLENNDSNFEQNVAKTAQENLGVFIANDLIDQTSDNAIDNNKINRLLAKLSDCFLALAKKNKTVIYFDDIQWADEFSANVVGKLLSAAKTIPLAIIISARIDEETKKIAHFNRWLENHTRQNSFSKIELKPFSFDECRKLFIETFDESGRIKSFTESGLSEIYKITGGNPYFLKELIYWLAADKRIVKLTSNESFSWQWNGMNKAELPSSLTSFALSRIESLAEKDRKVLEAACVIGEEFQVEMVAKVLKKDVSELAESLEIAAQKEILTKQILNRGNDYRFRHNLLYLTLYETILPGNLFYLHEQTAGILEELHQNDSQKIANSLAQHYEAAQNYQKCLEWSVKAAEYAREIEDWERIRKNVNRGELSVKKIDNIGSISKTMQFKLSFLKGYYLRRFSYSGKLFERSISAFQNSLSIATEINNPKFIADSLYNLSIIYRNQGSLPECLDALQKSQAIYESIGFDEGIANVKKGIAGYYMTKGRYSEAIKEIESGLRQRNLSGHIEINMKIALSEAYIYTGRCAEAEKLLFKIADICRNLSSDYELQSLNKDIGRLHVYLGQYELAVQKLSRVENFFGQGSETIYFLFSKTNKIKIRLLQGLFSESKAIIELFSPEIIASKEVYLIYLLEESLSYLNMEENNMLDAKSAISRFEKLVVDLDDVDLMSIKETLLAKYNNKIGKAGEANAHAQKGINFAKEAGNPLNQALAIIEQAFSMQVFAPLDAVKTAQKAVQILEKIKSGERWQAHWAVAQIQLSTSNKLVKTKEIVESLEKTVYLLDEIRNQFDLSNPENIKRYEESTKNFSEPARRLAHLFEKLGETQKSRELSKKWNL
jgi:DNA-binding winged helix-turn-helix (wHTH) protein